MIKQSPINWGKYIFITIATYSFLQDCSIHTLPHIKFYLPISVLSSLPMLFHN